VRGGDSDCEPFLQFVFAPTTRASRIHMAMDPVSSLNPAA